MNIKNIFVIELLQRKDSYGQNYLQRSVQMQQLMFYWVLKGNIFPEGMSHLKVLMPNIYSILFK